MTAIQGRFSADRSAQMLSYFAIVYLESSECAASVEKMVRLAALGDASRAQAEPDFRQCAELTEQDKRQIKRLVALCSATLQKVTMNEAEMQLWNRARRQVPTCRLFGIDTITLGRLPEAAKTSSEHISFVRSSADPCYLAA